MRLRIFILALSIMLATSYGANAQSPNAASGANANGYELVYAEKYITTYRPMQQHVVAPIREYHPQQPWLGFLGVQPYYVGSTRWEERWQTAYVPTTQRQYFAEARPATSPEPLIAYAQPPAKRVLARPALPTLAHARSQQDNPPLVAVPKARPATQTATTPQPQASLVPRNPPATNILRNTPAPQIRTVRQPRDPAR